MRRTKYLTHHNLNIATTEITKVPRSCEAAHEVSKVETQRGEIITSHSYWSRTHGPRETTHSTYGRRPWLWMVSRRGFLLPAGCRGSFSWQPRSRNGGGAGTEASSQKRDPS